MVLEKTLESPWTARRSNQSILKEISPGCSFEGLMLKMKLQYFGYLMRRADSFEKTLMLGEIGGRRRRGLKKMRSLGGITDSMHMSLSKPREMVKDREAGVLQSTGSQRVRSNLLTEQQQKLEGSGTLSLPASPISTRGFPRADLCLHHQADRSPRARD